MRTLARQAQTQIELRRVGGELTASIDRIKILSGLLPMCAWCGRMRTGDRCWQSVTQYLSTHSEAKITPGMCEDCARQVT